MTPRRNSGPPKSWIEETAFGEDAQEKRPCTSCRVSKVRCDKDIPCKRCVRLGIVCVEQKKARRGGPVMRTSHGRSNNKKSSSAAATAAAAALALSGDLDPSKQQQEQQQEQQQQTKFSSSSSSSSSSSLSSSAFKMGKRRRANSTSSILTKRGGGAAGAGAGAGAGTTGIKRAGTEEGGVVSQHRSRALSCTVPAPMTSISTVGASSPTATSRTATDFLSSVFADDNDCHDQTRISPLNGPAAAPAMFSMDAATTTHMAPSSSLAWQQQAYLISPMQTVMESFLKLHAHSSLCRGKTLAIMRGWALAYVKDHASANFDRLSVLSTALGLDWKLLLSHRETVHEAFEATRTAPNPTTTPTFQPEDLDPYLHALYTDASAAAALISINGTTRVCGNAAFAREYIDPETCNVAFARAQEQRTDPLDILGGLISREDQGEFFDSVGKMLFGEPNPSAEVAHICNTINRRRESVLSLARLRFIIADGGAFTAMVLSFQRLPNSRHLYGGAGSSSMTSSSSSSVSSLTPSNRRGSKSKSRSHGNRNHSQSVDDTSMEDDEISGAASTSSSTSGSYLQEQQQQQQHQDQQLKNASHNHSHSHSHNHSQNHSSSQSMTSLPHLSIPRPASNSSLLSFPGESSSGSFSNTTTATTSSEASTSTSPDSGASTSSSSSSSTGMVYCDAVEERRVHHSRLARSSASASAGLMGTSSAASLLSASSPARAAAAAAAAVVATGSPSTNNNSNNWLNNEEDSWWAAGAGEASNNTSASLGLSNLVKQSPSSSSMPTRMTTTGPYGGSCSNVATASAAEHAQAQAQAQAQAVEREMFHFLEEYF